MLQKLGFGLQDSTNKLHKQGRRSMVWTGGENVRFRYGSPKEKIGGWDQLGEIKKSLTGAATRLLHHWDNNAWY